MPAQTTPKAAIVEALQSLDHTDDKQWTDDGAPLVAKVAIICNDTTITRAQINDALPGFVRKTEESITEEVQPEDEIDDFNEPVSKDAETVAALMAPPDGEPLSEEDEYARLRAIAQRRVDDAQTAVGAAKDKVSEAIREVGNAEQRHARALQLFSAKYPPLTSAANIKQHLERQQEILRERVTGSRFEPNVAQNPVDETMMNRNRNNGRNNKGQTPTKFLPRSLGVAG